MPIRAIVVAYIRGTGRTALHTKAELATRYWSPSGSPVNLAIMKDKREMVPPALDLATTGCQPANPCPRKPSPPGNTQLPPHHPAVRPTNGWNRTHEETAPTISFILNESRLPGLALCYRPDKRELRGSGRDRGQPEACCKREYSHGHFRGKVLPPGQSEIQSLQYQKDGAFATWCCANILEPR